MKVYDTDKIRNLVFIGHGGCGKTSLVSGMLYSTGMTTRLGKVDEGNAVTDFDEDEIARKVSIRSALAYCEHDKHKLNLLDTPGYMAFIQGAREAIRVADTAMVVVDAVSGVEVQTEKVWEFANEAGLPRCVVISKMDRENADFGKVLENVQEVFGRAAVPVQIPVGKEKDFKGVIDLITGKAHLYKDDTGKCETVDVPANLKGEFDTRREQLVEFVAESDEDLMTKFFDSGSLDDADLVAGLKKGILSQAIAPVFCASGMLNYGTTQLADAAVRYLPSPLERAVFTATDPKTNEAVERKISADEPVAAYVFRTVADPFAGRISIFKVYSGVMKSDSSLYNVAAETVERIGALQVVQGKNVAPVGEVKAGDIGAVTKLKATLTGHSLSDQSRPVVFSQLKYPEAAISFAIEPKSRGDEEKISIALARMKEEDPMISFLRDPQTKELLVAGSGQLHVEVVVERMKTRYGVDVLLKMPKIPYRETITGKADVQGRHKKQTGGHGQFGDCKVRMEPQPRGAGFSFEDDIFGGAIPKTYIPAVEKGILESAERGYLAGYPVVDFKVSLYDGSYHEVDSSEMAFKIAGSLAFKKAMEVAKPVLLEPIMQVEVHVPEENAGDIMGNLNSRRGRVQGMDSRGKFTVIRAMVPMAEMLTYAPDLTSMTGGRGSYTMEIQGYEIVPSHIQAKIVEAAKKEREEEAE
ncbi:MAG: elongation factor G [Acidobacteria bacterium]|nr:elongation factor G [Acidobacteriota bacterium]